MPSAANQTSERQLRLIGEIAELLGGANVGFWLSGGWAVDFHAGRITRPHSDIDIIADLEDRPGLERLLEGAGLAAVGQRPGMAWFERDGLRLEVTFISRSGDGWVTPGYEDWPWSPGSFPATAVSFSGVSVRAVSVAGLLDMKRGFSERLGRPHRSYDSADIEVLAEPPDV